MTLNEALAKLKENIIPVREDIARAKDFICQANPDKLNGLVGEWMRKHNLEAPDVTNAEETSNPDRFNDMIRAYKIRMAFHHAVWELVGAGELVTVLPKTPGVVYSSGGPAAMPIRDFETVNLPQVRRIPSVGGMPTDTDIFLQGINCNTLHAGIREAIEQSLTCFRKGLYMPATAMLAAGAEATWTECGEAVAKKFAKLKLQSTILDPHVGIGRKVTEIRKILDSDGKTLLRDSGQSTSKIIDAELWTTTLRDRRNALHWGKAKSFTAEHSNTANLLLAAPLHISTLESIRLAC